MHPVSIEFVGVDSWSADELQHTSISTERYAKDIAEHVQLAARILAHSEESEGKRAPGKHQDLADRTQSAARGAHGEKAAVVVRATREFEEQGEVAEDILSVQTREHAPAIDVATDDRVPFMVSVVLGHRIDEAARHGARGIRAETGEAWLSAIDVKKRRALFEVPPVIASGDNEVDFLDVVLADVAHDQGPGRAVKRETERIP